MPLSCKTDLTGQAIALVVRWHQIEQGVDYPGVGRMVCVILAISSFHALYLMA